MAVILQMTPYLKRIYLNQLFSISVEISLKHVSDVWLSPTDDINIGTNNDSVPWDNKPLPEKNDYVIKSFDN